MHIDPDITQAMWEGGSAILCLQNVKAIRKSRTIAGVHWLPTAYFAGWGVYNLWFYTALHLPYAYWAGLAITLVNMVWLGHLGYYAYRRRQIVGAFTKLLTVNPLSGFRDAHDKANRAPWDITNHKYGVIPLDGRDQ